MGAHLRVQVPRKLITTNEAKRNCMRATECGKEAWSVNREPMNKNRIEGVAEQGERAMNREALVHQRATALPEREVSRGRSSWRRDR